MVPLELTVYASLSSLDSATQSNGPTPPPGLGLVVWRSTPKVREAVESRSMLNPPSIRDEFLENRYL